MKLIEAINVVRQPLAEGGKGLGVSVVCGFNPLHLLTFLEAELRLRHPDRKPHIHVGLYGDFWGNLDRTREQTNAATIVLLEWADLDPRLGIRSLGSWAPSVLPDLYRSVESRIGLLEAVLPVVAQKLRVAVCLPTLPLPPVAFTPGWQASELELKLRFLLAGLGCRLAEIENVRVLSPQRIDQLSPLSERFDVRSEVATGFPYFLNYASILAQQLSYLLDDISPKKGLITDLDGTLWRGILGEVGVEGISWDLDHRAHMHGVYQRFLHSLSKAGVLIAAASKNDPELVREAFCRKDLLLPAEVVFPIEAHWGAKSESVGRILRDWNVGPEAVVFLDDNAAELAEVQAIYPQMECTLFDGEQPEAVYRLLQDLRDRFGKATLTEEDGLRLETVRRNYSLPEDIKAPLSSPESFLRQAEAEVSFSFMKDPLDPRALELINKTNQFNLNGRRYDFTEWKQYISNPEAFLVVVSYRDKYGPLGKIAVLTGRHPGSTLVIDNWVMSCRAFGRHIEYKCLEVLFERYDAEEAEFDFHQTERNKPIRLFLRTIIGEDLMPTCTIQRSQFHEHSPETFQTVADVTHG